MPHKPHPTYYLLLPAAACYCLLLPATACYYLLLPATPCYFLLLPATYYLLPAPCCCLLLQVRGRLHLEGKHVNFDTLLRETSAVRGCGRPACCCLMLRAVRGVDSLPAHMLNMCGTAWPSPPPCVARPDPHRHPVWHSLTLATTLCGTA